MKKEYPFVVKPVDYDKMDVNFIVEYLDFSGVTGGGDTIEEAVSDAREALDMYMEILQEDGKTIPEPTNMSVSGRVTLRVPKTLHYKAVEAAEKEGVSLNSYICDSLAQRIYTNDFSTKLADMLVARTSEFLVPVQSTRSMVSNWIQGSYKKSVSEEVTFDNPKQEIYINNGDYAYAG